MFLPLEHGYIECEEDVGVGKAGAQASQIPFVCALCLRKGFGAMEGSWFSLKL